MVARQAARFTALALVATMTLVPGLVVSAPALVGPHAGVNAGITKYVSDNWAGYFAKGKSHTVTEVSGDWTQPSAKCGAGSSYAAFWVGIDGVDDSTVEQTGTLITCSGASASYSAWWELYPLNSIQVIRSISVAPDDKVTASVTFGTGGYTMSITVAGHSFSHTASQKADRTTAECIGERPSVGSSLTTLSDFKSVKFTSCQATISGHTQGIGSFGTVGEITMHDAAGHVLASASALSSPPSSFTVTWKRSS
jgi:hypothetical protein